MKRESQFTTEADLCAAFIAWAKGQGLIAYPETCGWDIVMVAPDGMQIGVQAKLKFNMKVLAQAVEPWTDTGPDYRAILVPEHGGGSDICSALGLGVFYPHWCGKQFQPCLDRQNSYADRWHFWNPVKRLKLPDYVPDVIAGASGPVQLTEWKIAALRITAVMEVRGFVTRADFKRYQIDIRRWATCGWMKPGERAGEWVRGNLEFHTQHQTVYPKILADVRTELAAEPVQPRLPIAQKQGVLA